ncbi:unnamed protein product [Rotaria socialis]|uniref:Reverse transcriptase domain-containing protein n=1 Tax=Rotaria socialis TaxID=392032 RepID=A0A820UTG5_9BILA|nr:unnamed protein product [Rotaria socialis]
MMLEDLEPYIIENIIIPGDFNASIKEWGSESSDKRDTGKTVLTKENEISDDLYRYYSEQFKAQNADMSDAHENQIETEYLELINKLSILNEKIEKANFTKIKKHILKLKQKKSSGFDAVSNFIIIRIPPGYISCLVNCFNTWLNERRYPDMWKLTKVVTLNKLKAVIPRCDQTRSILLLATHSKLFERIMLERLRYWAESNRLGPAEKSGFRSGYLFQTRVLSIFQEVKNNMTANIPTPAVYVDYQKAYDKVWHKGLVVKRNRMTIPLGLLKLIISWLNDRRVYVKFGENKSKIFYTHICLPQGSSSSSYLFIAYHSDLVTCLGAFSSHIFADDLNKWKQPVNFSKTVVQVFHSRVQNPIVEIYMEGKKLEVVKEFKYLGLTSANKMSLKPTIGKALENIQRTFSKLRWMQGGQEKSLPLHVIHVSTHQSFGTKHPHRSNILGVKARVSDIHHVMVKSRRHVHQNGKKTVHQHKNNHSHITETWNNETHLEKTIHSNNNYSKQRNCRCTYKCVFWYVFGTLILVLLSATIIIPLFMVPSKTTTTTGQTTTLPSYVWNATGITVIAVAASSPNALVVDSSNVIYVAEGLKNRVRKYDIGSSSSNITVAGQENGVSGSNSSFLNGPADLAVDSSNNVYVLDQLNDRVQLWTSGASSGITVAGFGGHGSNSSQFEYPYFMTRDSNTGTLYISDTNNWRIMQYASGASTGTLVAGGNGLGTSTNQLATPTGIYFDSSSSSFVIANYLGHNIVRWVLGASNWTLITGSTIGISGNSSTMLYKPMGLTVDYIGNIYVADTFNHRIQLFLAGQSNGTTIAGITGVCGTDADKLCLPRAVALDSQLNIYVADTGNNRIQKFSLN